MNQNTNENTEEDNSVKSSNTFLQQQNQVTSKPQNILQEQQHTQREIQDDDDQSMQTSNTFLQLNAPASSRNAGEAP